MTKILILISILFQFSVSSFAKDECPVNLDKAGLCAEYIWKTDLISNKGLELQLKVWKAGDKSRELVDIKQDFKVYTWMIMTDANGVPTHSHGSGIKSKITKVSKGAYKVSELWTFPGMRGYWELRIDIIDSSDDDKIISSYKTKLKLKSKK